MDHEPDDSFDRSEFFEPVRPRDAAVSPPAYPLVYRVSPGWKVTLVTIGLVIVVLSVLGMMYFGHSHKIRDDDGRLVLMGMCAVFFPFGVYCVAAAFLTRVTLYADALECRGLLRNLRVLRSEIASYRFRNANSITSLELLLTDAGKIRRISLLFAYDRAFIVWLEGLTNADEAQFQASYEEILEDVTLGDTPEERLARAKVARHWTGVLGIIGTVAVGAALFTSHAVLIVVLLVLPWLAIELARRFGSAVGVVDDAEVSVRGNLFPALSMPAFGLVIIALKMSRLEDWLKIITPTLVAAVAMLVLLAWIAPKMLRYPGKLVVIGLCFSLYAASTLAVANVYFDNAPPNDVVLDVSGKFSRDSRSGTHYYLLVLPWGTTKEAQEVNVNVEFYQFIQPGQEVCIHNHAGAFGLPWYEVAEASNCSRPFGGPG